MRIATRLYAMVALSVLGSATLLFSCNNKPEPTVYDTETLMTESSENRTITMMENGERSYTFTAPLIEGYSLAKNPYKEFRRGIKMTTFTSDSLALVDVVLTANYAIYYENQQLWEAKGHVVVIKHNRGKQDTTVTGLTEVYTQQLFWNAKTKKIYSNVDTKIVQPEGLHEGVGFDADDDLRNIHFRKYSSEMEFEVDESDREERSRERDAREAEAEAKAKETAADDSKSILNKGREGRETKPQLPDQRSKSRAGIKTPPSQPGAMSPRKEGAPASIDGRPQSMQRGGTEALKTDNISSARLETGLRADGPTRR